MRTFIKTSVARMRFSPLRVYGGFLVLALGAVLVLAACGGDGDESTTPTAGTQTPAATSEGTPAATPVATEAPGDTSDEPDDTGDSGSVGATLTIGSESWTVDNVFCAFSPEETGNDRVSFTMTGFTETAGGVRVQLDATIQDTEEQGRYEGDGVIHIVTIDDVDDFENPAVGWSSVTGLLGDSDDIIQVDGKSVTVETTFDNGLTDDVIEETPGTLEGTCP